MAPTDNIHCLLIPMWNEPLLVPNTGVAEIINFSQPEGGTGEPWFMGEIHWRGMYVPVINIEPELDLEQLDNRVRIAILNTSNGNPEQPFVGVLVRDIPKLSHVQSEDLEYKADEQESSQGIKAFMTLGNDRVRIPDLDALEKMAISVSF